MKGLIIKEPYIDEILSGIKKWEIRSSNTKIRGKIALIKSGTKKIYGEVELVNSFEINLEQYSEYCKDTYGYEAQNLPYKKTYAWVVEKPVVYDKAKPYNHPNGAIIWVNL